MTNAPKSDVSGLFSNALPNVSGWITYITQHVLTFGVRQSVQVHEELDFARATLDTVGPDEAERRARRLLQILGLHRLDVRPFVEALNIDDTKSNSVLALYGDSMQRLLLADAARVASTEFTADIIEKSLFDFAASDTARAHKALTHRIHPANCQQKRLQVINLHQFMFHLALQSERGTYEAELERLGETIAAILGAVYLTSGQQWQHNCQNVMRDQAWMQPACGQNFGATDVLLSKRHMEKRYGPVLKASGRTHPSASSD